MLSDSRIAFERAKIERAISETGQLFTFFSSIKDEYKEVTGEEEVTSLYGIYRNVYSGYTTVTVGDSGKTTKQYKPMALFLKDEKAEKIQKGHFFYKNGNKYVVNDISDLLGAGFALDASFEVMEV